MRLVHTLSALVVALTAACATSSTDATSPTDTTQSNANDTRYDEETAEFFGMSLRTCFAEAWDAYCDTQPTEAGGSCAGNGTAAGDAHRKCCGSASKYCSIVFGDVLSTQLEAARERCAALKAAAVEFEATESEREAIADACRRLESNAIEAAAMEEFRCLYQTGCGSKVLGLPEDVWFSLDESGRPKMHGTLPPLFQTIPPGAFPCQKLDKYKKSDNSYRDACRAAASADEGVWYDLWEEYTIPDVTKISLKDLLDYVFGPEDEPSATPSVDERTPTSTIAVP
jgi:hypothetical protein